jgi:hypothetical protein
LAASSLLEQIPDQRERRDQQHAHDRAARLAQSAPAAERPSLIEGCVYLAFIAGTAVVIAASSQVCVAYREGCGGDIIDPEHFADPCSGFVW